MLQNSKMRKYLAYAIGEILLVMVGILLALQVNIANEQRKENALELKLLKEIYRSVQRDSTGLLRVNNNNQNLIKLYGEIKDYMASDLPYHDSLGVKFSRVSYLISYKVQNAPFKSLENAGLNIIDNDSLRILIPRYYESMKRLQDTHAEFDIPHYFRENVYAKYFKSFSWGGASEPINYKALKNKPDFHVALDFVENDANFYFRRYSQMYQTCQQLLVMIRKEIYRMEH